MYLLHDCLVIPRFLVLSLYELVYLLRDCLVVPRFLVLSLYELVYLQESID